MAAMRSVLTSLILLIALAGLAAGGGESVRAMPDQPGTMAHGPGPDCDACAGDSSDAWCGLVCAAAAASELGPLPAAIPLGTDPSGRRLALASGLHRSATLAPDPPRPKLRCI